MHAGRSNIPTLSSQCVLKASLHRPNTPNPNSFTNSATLIGCRKLMRAVIYLLHYLAQIQIMTAMNKKRSRPAPTEADLSLNQSFNYKFTLSFSTKTIHVGLWEWARGSKVKQFSLALRRHTNYILAEV